MGMVAGGVTTDPIAVLERRSLERVDAGRQRPYFDDHGDTVARDGYYADINLDADAPTVVAQLSRLLATTHQRVLSYAPSEQLYPWVDLHPDGHLRNIYSGVRVDPGEVIRDDARIARARADRLTAAVRASPTMSAGDLHAAALTVEHELHFNCEHVVPQSWFSHRDPMRGDLHHLFTCEPTCNTKRANIPFVELSDAKPPVAGCGRTTADGSGFEPFTGKGPAARATLYFLLRYPGEIGERLVELQPQALPTLVAWHAADPVAEYERHRNAAIFEAQGNRNPFIDLPDLATTLDLAPAFSTPQ
jgi:endonuclease G